MMSVKITIWFLFAKLVLAQLNGEFWWLNTKVSEYNRARIPPPKYEHLSKFDTDESSKIVFRDDNFVKDNHTEKDKIINQIYKEKVKVPGDKNKVVWPNDYNNNKVTIGNNFPTDDTTKDIKTDVSSEKNMNKYVFKFPKEEYNIAKDIPTSTTTNTPKLPEHVTEATKSYADTVAFLTNKVNSTHEEENTHSQSICTYIKKYECNRLNGLVYSFEFGKSPKKGPTDPHLICCVLPFPIKKDKEETIEVKEHASIYFPDTLPNKKRNRRSNDEIVNAALRQRNILMQRKYANQAQNVSPASTQTKIVAPDSDEDPYWNIKSTNFHNAKKQTNHKSCDYSEVYSEDYVDEIPRPGLTGLYSDHKPQIPTIGTFVGQGSYGGGIDDDYDYEEDTDTTFGYSTIDPRKGLDSKVKKRGKPLKLSTASDEKTYSAESQTINFQSYPDFHVFQGFKLLNLFRNNRKQTTANLNDNDSKESLATRPLNINSENADDEITEEDYQIYKECGKAVKSAKSNDKGKLIGDAEIGTHPWLALVVQTRNLQNILCYATLVHPRAAITAADCVYGFSPGEITIIAGLWNLNDLSHSRRRVPSIHLHPKYDHYSSSSSSSWITFGKLANGLAVLDWIRPFRLDVKLQPACLADLESAEDCRFFGWGGFDQAIRLRPRWQRTTISACSSLRSSKSRGDLPNNAFCAILHSRSAVTGIGGPLTCNVDGRQAVVGVALYRDNAVVLLPAREFTVAAGSFMNED